jgi:hypothetical protein
LLRTDRDQCWWLSLLHAPPQKQTPPLHRAGLTEHFVAGTTAQTAAEPTGANHHTAIHYYYKLCETIAEAVIRLIETWEEEPATT